MKSADVVKGRYSTYQLLDLIGKGGHAAVFRAVDRSTGATVAIKKMTATDEHTLLQWRKEVEILNALQDDDSKYIIRYLDHMRLGNEFLIVEEFAPGGSLLKQLQIRGIGFEEREAARLMFQITSGLSYIHAKHVIHRDLKCANVLVSSNNIVKLSDFGLAAPNPLAGGAKINPNSATEEDTGTKETESESVIGSVYWMAPETIKGAPPDHRSDIWSLGCLCVELLTGKPPFSGRPPANALYHIAESNEIPLPCDFEMSEDCRNFLTQCLQRDPSQRPTASSLTKHPWFSDSLVNKILDMLVNESGSSVAPQTNHGGKGQEDGAKPTNSPRLGLSSGGSATHSAAISRWVESNLFAESVEQREQWLLDGGLKKVVAVLPKITAGESFNIVRSFVFAAQRCRTADSCFLTQLGDANLWDHQDLSIICKVEDLATLFCCCCEKQDPRVPQYTPSHPKALQFLLRSTEGDVASSCVEALHLLLIGRENPTHVHTEASSGNIVIPPDNGLPSFTSMQRHMAARQRMIADRGLLAIREIIEHICHDAFTNSTEPHMRWLCLDKLFEITSLSTSVRSDYPLSSSSGISQTLDGSNSVLASGIIPENGPSCESVLSREGSTVRIEGLSHSLPSSVEQTGNRPLAFQERWLLALQEASNNLCRQAILILIHTVQYASKGKLYSQYLAPMGKGITGTLLMVGSSASVDLHIRMSVMVCLPYLQSLSLKVSTFLRDERSNISLIAHIVKCIPVPEGDLEKVFKVLFTLCEDKRMAVAFATSGSFVSVLIEKARALASCGKLPELLLSIKYIELLLAHTTDTTRYTNSGELIELLIRLANEEGNQNHGASDLVKDVRTLSQCLLENLQAQSVVY